MAVDKKAIDYHEALAEAKKLANLFSSMGDVIEAAIEAEALIAESKPTLEKFEFEKQMREKQLKKLQQEFESRQAEIAQAEKDLKSLKDAHAAEDQRFTEQRKEFQKMQEKLGIITPKEGSNVVR